MFVCSSILPATNIEFEITTNIHIYIIKFLKPAPSEYENRVLYHNGKQCSKSAKTAADGEIMPKLVTVGFASVYLTKHWPESSELIELFDRKEYNLV